MGGKTACSEQCQSSGHRARCEDKGLTIPIQECHYGRDLIMRATRAETFEATATPRRVRSTEGEGKAHIRRRHSPAGGLVSTWLDERLILRNRKGRHKITNRLFSQQTANRVGEPQDSAPGLLISSACRRRLRINMPKGIRWRKIEHFCLRELQ